MEFGGDPAELRSGPDPGPWDLHGLDQVSQCMAERAEAGRLDGGDRRAGRGATRLSSHDALLAPDPDCGMHVRAFSVQGFDA
jgi:hypothetical protein